MLANGRWYLIRRLKGENANFNAKIDRKLGYGILYYMLNNLDILNNVNGIPYPSFLSILALPFAF